jgi:sentrin-specific protease 1
MNKRFKDDEKKSYFFNSFFYEQYKIGKADGWYKTVLKDLFSEKFDLYIPIHVNGNHWCLMKVSFENKTMTYYDSLKGDNQQAFRLISRFLSEKSQSFKISFKEKDWKSLVPKNIPSQENCDDCGVFCILFFLHLSHQHTLNFSHVDIPNFRYRLAYIIIKHFY